MLVIVLALNVPYVMSALIVSPGRRLGRLHAAVRVAAGAVVGLLFVLIGVAGNPLSSMGGQ